MTPAPSSRRALLRFAPVLGLVALITVFHAVSIREGHDWGDDFAMYILHARNIAEGRSYEDTGYLYNPRYPSLGPRTYPPVFPLMLAPVYGAFGLNLHAMKLEILLFLAAALLVVFLTLEGIVSNTALLALIAAVGFSPPLWDLKDSIVSDIPFFFFFFLSLLLFTRWRRETTPRSALTGAVMYLAYGTRTVGVVLVVALLLHDLIRSRRITRFALIASAVVLAGAVAQGALIHGSGSYFDTFAEFRPRTILVNARYYLSWGSALWDNGYVAQVRKPLFAAALLLAAGGFAARVRNGITVLEIAFAGMVGLLLAWPGLQGFRFLLPLVPLFFLYLVLGIQLVNSGKVLIAVFGVTLMTYAARYTTMDFEPLAEGIGKPQSAALFEYVSTRTSPDAVVVFSKPRALALFGGRRSTAVQAGVTDAEVTAFLRQTGARYLVVGPPAAEEDRREYLLGYVSRNRERLIPEFSNSDFQLFAIR